MTLIHIVLFTFKPEVNREHKKAFVREVKTLKNLPSVKGGRLIVGGPSLTHPIELSKNFEFALVSYHENIAALDEYEASEEHNRVTTTYMFPFDKVFCRFDFEVDPEDEYMCAFGPLSFLAENIPGDNLSGNGKGE
ncbi:Amino acid/polyamine transporter I [Penicillium atrosanguineum]|uniref:Amino acid/polyamine transporter I n=1 Tax=Penicillium atrosanguineum TaxID=1132637 RepID=UPI0023A69D16|nr:Amino acid/polyamine transporter I [Penicillium atrosanguineum]KAJ5297282.1 Amino acid/polyamine transporter I [Penicillium atrosanguineum]